jgi:hypothetical protein
MPGAAHLQLERRLASQSALEKRMRTGPRSVAPRGEMQPCGRAGAPTREKR